MSKGRKGRSREQILKERAEIANLYLQGWIQADIASKLGLSRQQIGYDLNAIREEWLKSSLRDFDQRKAEELARIDRIEQVAWDAWEASKRERHITTSEQITDSEGERLKAGIRKTDQVGDPRFLAEIRCCIRERSELLGLYPAKKIAPTTPDGKEPYELIPGFASLLSELKTAVDRQGSGTGPENPVLPSALCGPGTGETGPGTDHGIGESFPGPLAEEVTPLEFSAELASMLKAGGQEHGLSSNGPANGTP